MREKTKRKPAPKKTAARCRVDLWLEEIRAHRRSMTAEERIEALEFIMDEAIMALGGVDGIVRQGPEKQQGAAAMWLHVTSSAATILRLEERAQLKKDRAAGIVAGTPVAIYYKPPPGYVPDP